MSAINTYLNGIRNHDWASDVRDDIVNAITECYNNSTIADGAITPDKIENGAVRTAKIKDLAVTEAKVAAGAITTAKLADGAVTGAKISKETIDLVASNASTQTIDTVDSVTFNMSGSVIVLNCVFTTARIVNSNGALFTFNGNRSPISNITVPIFDNSGNVKFVKIDTSGRIIVSSANIPIGTYILNAMWIR